MKTRASCVLCLILPLVMASRRDPAPAADTQATAITAGIAATLTAPAPLPQTVVVITPPPSTSVATEPTRAVAIATLPPPTRAATEPPPTIDLSNLRLEADGRGDLPSLDEALVQSEPGATITLGPGSYRLEQAITIGGSLHLVGEDRDRTEIVASVPDWVLRFQGKGPFSARGITFRHDGDAPADVVAVGTGEVDFQDCRFTGAVWGDENGVGSGLSLEGATMGQVSGSESVENELHGILLWDQAQVNLNNNLLQQNGDSGVAYFGNTAGKALQNEVRDNASYGIYVDDRAALALESNTLRDNGKADIAYFGNAAGQVEDNRCAGDSGAGIYVAENATPWLGDNECTLQEAGGNRSDSPATARREIVYAAWRLENEDIYAMWADGTGAIQLTSDPARDNEPAWSPDGTQIVFVSERDGNPEI